MHLPSRFSESSIWEIAAFIVNSAICNKSIPSHWTYFEVIHLNLCFSSNIFKTSQVLFPLWVLCCCCYPVLSWGWAASHDAVSTLSFRQASSVLRCSLSTAPWYMFVSSESTCVVSLETPLHILSQPRSSLVSGYQTGLLNLWNNHKNFLCYLSMALDAEENLAPGLPLWGSPGSSDCKVSAYIAGDLGSIPGLGRSPGEGDGNPLQYSCLENPMDGGTW